MSRKNSGRDRRPTDMGLATAKRFVQEEVDLVFITAASKTLDAAVAEIGKSVTAIQGDVANLSDLDRLYDIVKNTVDIDIIYANAGARNSRHSGRSMKNF